MLYGVTHFDELSFSSRRDFTMLNLKLCSEIVYHVYIHVFVINLDTVHYIQSIRSCTCIDIICLDHAMIILFVNNTHACTYCYKMVCGVFQISYKSRGVYDTL